MNWIELSLKLHSNTPIFPSDILQLNFYVHSKQKHSWRRGRPLDLGHRSSEYIRWWCNNVPLHPASSPKPLALEVRSFLLLRCIYFYFYFCFAPYRLWWWAFLIRVLLMHKWDPQPTASFSTHVFPLIHPSSLSASPFLHDSVWNAVPHILPL